MREVYSFLKPKLCGHRFENHTIPLDVLKDFSVFEQMVVEVAKWLFLRRHPERVRSPRGFTDGVRLTLSGIGEGSAIPNIDLSIDFEQPTLISPKKAFFEEARDSILKAINAAQENADITKHLPPNLLAYFDKFGRSLRDGESIEFSTPSKMEKSYLNKDTRRKLVLASTAQEITEEVTLNGSVPEADQDRMSFILQLPDGCRVPSTFSTEHIDTIINAFTDYSRNVAVMVQGIGRYDRNTRLKSIESVEHINLIPPTKIKERLDQLKKMQDGWIEGEGFSISDEDLDWLEEKFEKLVPGYAPSPYIYPTPEGGIQIEWSLMNHEISLEINIHTRQGEWQDLDLSTMEEKFVELDLTEDEAWKWGVQQIMKMSVGHP